MSGNRNKIFTLLVNAATASTQLLYLCADGVVGARTSKDTKDVAKCWHEWKGRREVLLERGEGIVKGPTQRST